MWSRLRSFLLRQRGLDERRRFSNTNDGVCENYGAGPRVERLDVEVTRQETMREHTSRLCGLLYALVQPFPSSSARSSATFAASIASEISNPGKAPSIAVRASSAGYTRHDSASISCAL